MDRISDISVLVLSTPHPIEIAIRDRLGQIGEPHLFVLWYKKGLIINTIENTIINIV